MIDTCLLTAIRRAGFGQCETELIMTAYDESYQRATFYGCQEPLAFTLNISRIAIDSGLERSGLYKAFKSLVEKRVFVQVGPDSWHINASYQEWQSLTFQEDGRYLLSDEQLERIDRVRNTDRFRSDRPPVSIADPLKAVSGRRSTAARTPVHNRVDDGPQPRTVIEPARQTDPNSQMNSDPPPSPPKTGGTVEGGGILSVPRKTAEEFGVRFSSRYGGGLKPVEDENFEFYVLEFLKLLEAGYTRTAIESAIVQAMRKVSRGDRALRWVTSYVTNPDNQVGKAQPVKAEPKPAYMRSYAEVKAEELRHEREDRERATRQLAAMGINPEAI